MKRVLLLVFLALALAACSSAPAEVNLQATDIAFDMKTIEVKAGQVVRLTYVNAGALDHDFTILQIPVKDVNEVSHSGAHDMGDMTVQPDVHITAKAGTTAILEFTPTTPGEYEYYCTVAGHKEAGMTGTLIVK